VVLDQAIFGLRKFSLRNGLCARTSCAVVLVLCARAQTSFGPQLSHCFCGFLWVFARPFFGLSKPFPAVSDYVIIGPHRPVKTAYFGLIFLTISAIFLLHTF
jgi:hypothetical protein